MLPTLKSSSRPGNCTLTRRKPPECFLFRSSPDVVLFHRGCVSWALVSPKWTKDPDKGTPPYHCEQPHPHFELIDLVLNTINIHAEWFHNATLKSSKNSRWCSSSKYRFTVNLKMDAQRQKCREWVQKLSNEVISVPGVQQTIQNPRNVLYAGVLLLATVWLLIRATKSLRKSAPSRPATPDLEKPAARAPKAPARKPGGAWEIIPEQIPNQNHC